MKKYTFWLLIIITIVMVSAVKGQAAEMTGIEKYAGLGVNKFETESKVNSTEEIGISCVGGIRRWIDDNFAFGAELEYLEINSDYSLLNDDLVSFSQVIVYKLPLTYQVRDGSWDYRYQFIRKSNFNIKLIGGIGAYINDLSTTGVGAKLGTEIELPVAQNSFLIFRGGYRKVDIDLTSEVQDLSGYGISAIFNFRF